MARKARMPTQRASHVVGEPPEDEVDPVIRLAPIDAANRKAVLALKLGEDQQDLVEDNAGSLREARHDDDAVPRAVVLGERVVGFLMYDASAYNEALLYRFMIDLKEQGRGYGRAALQALVREVQTLGRARDIIVHYMPENAGARRLYLGFGFVEEGEDEDGEIIARLPLSRKKNRK